MNLDQYFWFQRLQLAVVITALMLVRIHEVVAGDDGGAVQQLREMISDKAGVLVGLGMFTAGQFGHTQRGVVGNADDHLRVLCGSDEQDRIDPVGKDGFDFVIVLLWSSTFLFIQEVKS